MIRKRTETYYGKSSVTVCRDMYKQQTVRKHITDF